MSMIKVTGLAKSFGKIEVLRNISFSVEKGEVLSIIAVSYTHLDVYKRQT